MSTATAQRAAPSLQDWRTEIGAHPRVQEARKDLDAAQARLEAVTEEVAELRGKLADADRRIEEVTKAGDPEGIVRTLTRERRKLRDRLEEAEADLAAQEAARKGAHREYHRVHMATMGELWDALPLGDVAERFRDRVRGLLESVEEIERVYGEQKWAHDRAVNVVSRILEGHGQSPALEAPDVGVPEPIFRQVAREVRKAADHITATEEE